MRSLGTGTGAPVRSDPSRAVRYCVVIVQGVDVALVEPIVPLAWYLSAPGLPATERTENVTAPPLVLCGEVVRSVVDVPLIRVKLTE